jgi:hypothetical protein
LHCQQHIVWSLKRQQDRFETLSMKMVNIVITHFPTQINLWGGSTSRLTGGRVFFVEEYILHPQYDIFTLDNDVAVLRMDVSKNLKFKPDLS